MIFPSDNLGTASKPWAREVTKQLSNIIDISTSNNINNTARDNQLNSSIIAASAAATAAQTAATKAQEAIDALGNLDQETSTYKINAANLTVGSLSGDRISGGTITGTTVQTAATGGVKISNETSSVSFRNGSTTVGHILPFASNGVIMHYGSNPDGNAGSFPQMYVGSGNVSMAANNSNFIGISSSGIGMYGPINHNSSYSNSGNITTDGSIIRTALIAGATTGASITAGGALVRTSSSARYKQDIEDIEFNYQDVLALQPKKFRLKDDVSYNEDAPFHVGFIAEDLAGTPLDIFVNYKELDGEMVPDGVQYLGMTAMLLSTIKQQDALIKDLTSRIEALEG